MTKDNHTPEGLPIVSKDTLEVLERDFQRRTEEGKKSLVDFMADQFVGIGTQNPALFQYLDKVRNLFEGSQRNAYLMGVLITYNSLRNQAESDSA